MKTHIHFWSVTQTYVRETPYRSIKLHLKQVFRIVYRHELETRLSHKLWTREISKVTDWPRRRPVAEFRLCVGHACLGAHLHRIGIRPDPYCKLRYLHEPMDRNRLGQCTALSNKTECERYWEAGTKMMGNWLCYFIITIFCDYPLALGLYIYPHCFLFFCFFVFKVLFFFSLLLGFTFIGRIGQW